MIPLKPKLVLSHTMANPDSTSDLLSTLSLDESGVPRSIYDLVIDFGTTFTKAGALRVWPKQDLRARNGSASLGSILNDIVIIDRYPGPHSSKRLSEEAPTTWVYKGKSLIAWGVDLDDRQDDQEVTLALVKLLLDESGRGSVEKQKLKGKLELIGLSVSDVITDYLRSLLRHAAKKIDNIDPSQKLIRIILCIPSIWKPLAQKTMREACQKALFTGMMLREQKDHGLITEPEAVAAFLMEKYPELDVKAGDLIAVLDCGGGTSDVALLDIEQRKPLRMSQVAPVDGAMLGSIFLDEGFEKLLRRRLSHLSNIPRSKLESSVRKAVAEFKHELKTAFEVGDVRDLSIWFGGLLNDPENRITPNRVWFTETEFREIFDPVARGNVKLVVDLYEGYKRNMERENSPIKKLKYLFFVGGLAGSLYMENAVRKAFSYDNILGHAVTVRTPMGLQQLFEAHTSWHRMSLSLRTFAYPTAMPLSTMNHGDLVSMVKMPKSTRTRTPNAY
ncbi:hypothetical protein BDZ45DRAFT_511162 [Acephala macrosclerotiorum]|nr:hypothetical protein BDZ45DRAFT_511162 [Acephala macrosclerotiorum]